MSLIYWRVNQFSVGFALSRPFVIIYPFSQDCELCPKGRSAHLVLRGWDLSGSAFAFGVLTAVRSLAHAAGVWSLHVALSRQEQWKDTRRWQLAVAEELPELEESPQEAGRGFSRFGNGRQSDGGFKRNNWFRNGNRGRDFNKSLD